MSLDRIGSGSGSESRDGQIIGICQFSISPPTSLPVPPPHILSPVPANAGPEAVGSTADMEWRAQRLECLMYRVLWVSETVKKFREQYSPHSGGPHYELFIKATNWAKGLADE